MNAEPLVAHHDGVRLAGSLCHPERKARALVLMYPGSGPSDRDNDVLFPPIRAALLDAGAAVCSFDKRGVGGSSGDWLDADIPLQAADLAAGLAAAREVVRDLPTGLFGHSQGGWVVQEAAAQDAVGFVITNSGPAVGPREQETYSTAQTLRLRGWRDHAAQEGLRTFTRVMDLLALPFDIGWPRARALPLIDELVAAGVFVPADPDLWAFAARVMPHDPQGALRTMDVPLLALFGEDDDVVPVARSAAILRTVVRPDLLDLHVLPRGDHRLQHGEDFVPDYLETLTRFVVAQMDAAG